MKKIINIMAAAALICIAASCEKTPKGPTDFSGGCEAVDLGLSVKWASYNVGAQNIDGYGFYFAWGETKEKENYSWAKKGDYKWGVFDGNDNPKRGMTKYTAELEGGDGLKTLQSKDDPAIANWGTKWRTPTFDEIKELLDETKCEWTWDEARKGYIVKGRATGNSIFLPVAGDRHNSNLEGVGVVGNYWSASVYESYPNNAYSLYFSSISLQWAYRYRLDGYTVRAVTEY